MRAALKASPRLAACALILACCGATARAQVVPGSLSVGIELGTGMYIGEFNSFEYQGALAPTFGTDLGGVIRYDIAPFLSLVGTVGLTQVDYRISDYNLQRYAPFFFGSTTATTYPGSTVAITNRNHITIDRYYLMARTHFTPSSAFVPYATFGLGMIDFKVRNDKEEELPTNLTGSYDRTGVVVPVGLGAEYHLSDRIGIYMQGLFHINFTDYLDGYAHYIDFADAESSFVSGPGVTKTPPDYFATLALGLTVNLYRPESEAEPPPPIGDTARPAVDSVPPERQPAPAPDSDGDGLSDNDERNRYMTDPFNPDTDGDNLSDYDEIRTYNTSANNRDTDNDGLTDGAEVIVYNTNPLAADTDADGLVDGQEIRLYKSDPRDVDTDGDTLGDGVEVTRLFTDPLSTDTDRDGVPDGADQCPNVAGDPANNGCPTVMTPSDYSERLRQTGPLKGLPESPMAGDRTDFSGIYFRVNSDDFDLSRPETARNLTNLLNYMKQCQELGVTIEGHTSSEGSAARNKELSLKRAQRVRQWLLDNGVEPNKILGAVGYGSILPRVPEPQEGKVPASLLEQIRKQNRRITTLVEHPCK